MEHRIWRSGSALLLSCVLGTPAVLACGGAPFSDAWNWGGSSAWEDDGGDCSLRAQVTAIPASAMVSTSYLRRVPAAPLRLRFTLDAPGLPPLNAAQSASLARGVMRRVEPSSLPAGPVFNLSLSGNLGASKYYLALEGWCASGSAHSCSSVVPAFGAGDFPLEITLDVEVGAGESGRLRLWVNTDPDTTTPSLQLNDLDNAVTGGIDRVAIGLFSTSPTFNEAVAGVPFVFRHVESSDDTLFWSDFESLLPGNVEPNRPALQSGFTHGGTTCGGSGLLPQVAHGTASLYGPVAIHPVSLVGGTVSFDLFHSGELPLMMFLCPAGAGPSGACFAAGRSNGIQLVGTDVPPGDYQLAVGASQPGAPCIDYTVQMVAPFDD